MREPKKRNFLYNIHINQYALINHFPELDDRDGIMFDYIKQFASSQGIKQMQYNGSTYFWLKWSKIADDVPILSIKSRQGIKKRLDKLVNSGILIPYENNQTEGMSYYTQGPKWNLMIYTEPVNENNEVTTGVYRGVNGGLHNNNINNNTNTYIQEEVKENLSMADLQQKKEPHIEQPKNKIVSLIGYGNVSTRIITHFTEFMGYKLPKGREAREAVHKEILHTLRASQEASDDLEKNFEHWVEYHKETGLGSYASPQNCARGLLQYDFKHKHNDYSKRQKEYIKSKKRKIAPESYGNRYKDL